MKSAGITALFGLVLAFAVGEAIATGTLEFSIMKQKRADAEPLRRRDAVEDDLIGDFNGQDGVAYYLNVSVGTPGQLQTVQLDTGSSDFYFTASNSSFCDGTPGCAGGTFDPDKSSSFSVLQAGGFNTSFGDGSTDAGDYITDVVQVGDLAITGAVMGLAYQVNSTVGAQTGLMGIGYSINEGVQPGQAPYPNFPESLVGAKAIASRFYSLFLNDISQVGSIIFGGVDTKKYTGDLVTLDFFPTTEDQVTNFIIAVGSIDVSQGGQSQTIYNRPFLVLPDSGSTAFTVPNSLYEAIVKLVNINDDGTAPCNTIYTDTTFTLNLTGSQDTSTVLSVPLSSMFTPAYTQDGSIALDPTTGAALCVLQVQPDTSDELGTIGFTTMGDSIMRSGYWAFDLDNGQLSVAQAAINATDANIVAVDAGPGMLAKAISQPAQDTTPTQTAVVAQTATATVTYSVATAASTAGHATASPSPSKGAGARFSGGEGAAGVGGVVAVVAVAVGMVL